MDDEDADEEAHTTVFRAHGGVGHPAGDRDGLLPHPHTLPRDGAPPADDGAGRITTQNWDLYDTRHAVIPAGKDVGEALEAGYWRAYKEF
jgi:hypothetical protein